MPVIMSAIKNVHLFLEFENFAKSYFSPLTTGMERFVQPVLEMACF